VPGKPGLIVCEVPHEEEKVMIQTIKDFLVCQAVFFNRMSLSLTTVLKFARADARILAKRFPALAPYQEPHTSSAERTASTVTIREQCSFDAKGPES